MKSFIWNHARALVHKVMVIGVLISCIVSMLMFVTLSPIAMSSAGQVAASGIPAVDIQQGESVSNVSLFCDWWYIRCWWVVSFGLLGISCIAWCRRQEEEYTRQQTFFMKNGYPSIGNVG